MEIPDLVVIKDDIVTKKVSLEELIKEKKLLKLKLKLMHIFYLEHDLVVLDRSNLTLSDIALKDIYLENKYLVVAPIKNRVIAKQNDYNIKLKCYLIYLSYIYNVNLFSYYENNRSLFNELMSLIKLNKHIKENLEALINNNKANFFYEYLEELNKNESLETIINDRFKLVKRLNEMSNVKNHS